MAKDDRSRVEDDLDEDKKPKNGQGEDDEDVESTQHGQADGEDADKAPKDGKKDADGDQDDDDDGQDSQDGASADEEAQLSPEEQEQRAQARRDERRRKKERRREREQQKEAELQYLRRRVSDLDAGQQQIIRRTTGHEIGQLDRAIGEIGQIYAANKAKRKAAMEAGDANAFEEADAEMQKCLINHQRLTNVKERLKTQAQSTQRQENPRAQQLGTEWLAKRSWYQPDGDGEDSLIARVIDQRLAEEGLYDPGSQEYWAELDRRLAKRLPHRYQASSRRSEEDTEVRKDPPRRNGGPPTGSGGRNGGAGGGGFKLSADRVQAMKDAGHWDDPRMKAKMIKRYQDFDREAAANRS